MRPARVLCHAAPNPKPNPDPKPDRAATRARGGAEADSLKEQLKAVGVTLRDRDKTWSFRQPEVRTTIL